MVSLPPDLLEHQERIHRVLQDLPAGLFLDIDGTLSALQPNPASVSISDTVRRAIAKLSGRFAVVVLSGRATADCRRIIGLDDITYVGNHGCQWFRDGLESTHTAAQEFIPRMHQIATDALTRFADSQGIYVENKGPSVSIHYRNTPNPAVAALDIDRFIDEHSASDGLRCTDGKLVKEVRPPLDINKGTAVTELVEEWGLRGAVMIGDDSTDVDAFLAIKSMCEANRIRGMSVAVLTEGTPKHVLSSADYSLDSTDAVERLLVLLSR